MKSCRRVCEREVFARVAACNPAPIYVLGSSQARGDRCHAVVVPPFGYGDDITVKCWLCRALTQASKWTCRRKWTLWFWAPGWQRAVSHGALLLCRADQVPAQNARRALQQHLEARTEELRSLQQLGSVVDRMSVQKLPRAKQSLPTH